MAKLSAKTRELLERLRLQGWDNNTLSKAGSVSKYIGQFSLEIFKDDGTDLYVRRVGLSWWCMNLPDEMADSKYWYKGLPPPDDPARAHFYGPYKTVEGALTHYMLLLSQEKTRS